LVQREAFVDQGQDIGWGSPVGGKDILEHKMEMKGRDELEFL
jgi:hypothetical protein